MTEPTIIAIDESIVTTTTSETYIIGSAIIIDPAQQSAVAQFAREALHAGSPQRRRPFHWTAEGPDIRTAMINVAATHTTPVAIVRPFSAKNSESARLDCLTALFQHTSQYNTDLVLFESREQAMTNIGQNRVDHQAITAARHANVVPPTVKYQWVNKTEPIVWLADAIAGAVNLHQRGDTTYTRLLPTLHIQR